MKITDYSSWNIYEGASEGSGRSEKIWLSNKQTDGLFKFTKSDETTEHISEKLAADLAGLLGLNCAKIEIGVYNARVGSMSYRINDTNQILIEGIYLINKLYPYYDPNSMYDSVKEEYYSLEMILNSFAEYNLKDEFLKILIFDFLIGNTDRHQNNWAILKCENNIKICPIYDNGSSLCCYIEEKNIDSYLGKDKLRFNSIVDSKSKSRIRINKKVKKEPTHLEVLQHIKQHNSSSDILNLINNTNILISEKSLDKIISVYPEGILSSKRKKLIKMFLLEKVALMNDVFSRKEE